MYFCSITFSYKRPPRLPRTYLFILSHSHKYNISLLDLLYNTDVALKKRTIRKKLKTPKNLAEVEEIQMALAKGRIPQSIYFKILVVNHLLSVIIHNSAVDIK